MENEKAGKLPEGADKKTELHKTLSTLVENLVNKIQMKHESLIDSQAQLTQYQTTLKQKYNPIFDQMEEIILEKKMEYMDHLTSNLEDNYKKIQLEKDTLSKLERSFN